jgi:hypothetical protein
MSESPSLNDRTPTNWIHNGFRIFAIKCLVCTLLVQIFLPANEIFLYGLYKNCLVILALCFIDYIVIPQPKVSEQLYKRICWFFVPKKKHPKNRPQKVTQKVTQKSDTKSYAQKLHKN